MGMKPFFKEQDHNRDFRGGPPRGSWGSPQRLSPEPDARLKEVIGEIKKLNRMTDLPTKSFADLDGYADKVALAIQKQIKTSQLRKFFEPLVEIEAMLKRGESWKRVENRLYMSIPALAYAVSRDLAPKGFYELMVACIKKIDVQGSTEEQKKENFERFMEFLRAIVAYNKYHGGD